MTKEKDYFKTFCNILSAIGTASSTKKILSLIVKGAIEAMDGKAACLYLDRSSDYYKPVAQEGLSENYLHANPVKAKKSIKALDEGGYLSFPDATTDPRLENRDVKKAEGIASILTVPVKLNDRTIGALTLYTATRRDFSPSEVEFLRALAEQGAIVIEKSRLIERMRKNALLFLGLSSSINSSLDIRKILHTLTVNVCESLGMKGAVIRLLDEETREMKIVASHGLSEEFLNLGTQLDPLTADRVLKGESLFIGDGIADERITYKDAMKKEGVVAMVATPIKAKDNIIGVMRLYGATQRQFPPDLMTMIEAIGHQGGLAIQNGSMYLQLQESKKVLEQEIWSHRSWF